MLLGAFSCECRRSKSSIGPALTINVAVGPKRHVAGALKPWRELVGELGLGHGGRAVGKRGLRLDRWDIERRAVLRRSRRSLGSWR